MGRGRHGCRRYVEECIAVLLAEDAYRAMDETPTWPTTAVAQFHEGYTFAVEIEFTENFLWGKWVGRSSGAGAAEGVARACTSRARETKPNAVGAGGWRTPPSRSATVVAAS